MIIVVTRNLFHHTPSPQLQYCRFYSFRHHVLGVSTGIALEWVFRNEWVLQYAAEDTYDAIPPPVAALSLD